MKMRTVIGATLIAITASCASAPPDYAKTPPPPGPDIYRCTDGTGYTYFERVKAGMDQQWLGDHWSPNVCDIADSKCTADPEGLFVIETSVVLPRTGDRIDKIEIYNPKAGTVLSTIALNGVAGAPNRHSCTPHT